jgi:hypothetical protein
LNPPESDLRQNEELRRRSYPSGGGFGVTIDGKIQIRHSTAAATFVEAIEEVGIERVKKLGIECRYVPLIDNSISVYFDEIQRTESGSYSIVTDSSTGRKKRILDEIIRWLGVDMVVDHFYT